MIVEPKKVLLLLISNSLTDSEIKSKRMVLAVIELAFIILDQILLLFEPFICGILSRLRVKLETNRDFYVTKVFGLKDHTFDISLNGLNGEIKSFYDLHNRTLGNHNDSINNNVVDVIACGFRPKKRLSPLKQAMELIESEWPSIKFHPVTFDSIDRQLNWLNYDLCLVEDWDFPNVMPNLSQFVGMYETSKTDNQTSRRKNSHSKCNREHGDGWLDEKNSKIEFNKWSETRIAYSSSANRKFFLEFITLKDTEVALKRTSIKSGRKQQPPSKTTILAGISEAGENVYRSQKQNIVDKSILCVKWATFDEFSLNEARSRLVFYYTQIHPDLPSLYLVLMTILESAGLIEPSSNSLHLLSTFDTVGKSPNKSFDDIWKSDRWRNLDKTDLFSRYGLLTNNNNSHQIDRYTLILMIVAYFNSKEAKSRRDNGEACQLAQHLIGFLTVYMMRRHDRKSRCDSNDFDKFNENTNNDVDKTGDYNDQDSLNSRCFYVVRPTFKQVGELELVIENRDNPPNYYGVKSGLVVLDPISRDGKSSLPNNGSRLIGCHKFNESRNENTDIGNDNKEELNKRFTNLTKDLETMIEIQRLFAHLRAHLCNIEHISSKRNLKDHKNLDSSSNSKAKVLNCEESSVLQTLFTLSSKKSHLTSLFERNFERKLQILTLRSEALKKEQKERKNSPSLSQLKETTTLKEISNHGEEPEFGNQGGVEWEETRLPYRYAVKKILISASKLGKLLSSFRWQKILTNFLYLGLFLLARNVVLGYLESFQSDLRDQARDDMTMQPEPSILDAKNAGPSSSSSSSLPNRYVETNLHEVDNKIEDSGEASFGSDTLADYPKIHKADERASVDQMANEKSKKYDKGWQSIEDEAREKLKLDDIDDKLLEELLDTILRQALVDLDKNGEDSPQ